MATDAPGLIKKYWRKPRRHIWVVLVCSVAIAFVCALIAQNDKPVYAGRPLASWVEDLADHDQATFEQAVEAVEHIGTKSIPFLIKWVSYEPPKWYAASDELSLLGRSLVRVTKSKCIHSMRRSLGSITAFEVLGTNAAIAAPKLSAIMTDTSRHNAATTALICMSYLGTTAWPAMTAALENTNYPYRDSIAYYIGINMAPDVGTNVCLAALRNAMDDPDPAVRETAARITRRLSRSPSANESPQ